MRMTVVAAIGLGLLGGCSHGGREGPAAAVPVAGRVQSAMPAASEESLWHLRVGLNVAALMCRGSGRVSVAGDYARLLGRHSRLFASAYAAEQRRQGSGFDRHQTRLYNRFSNQRDPAGFCRRASRTAKQALALDSGALARAAGGLLAQID
jgi:hypothetical protein